MGGDGDDDESKECVSGGGVVGRKTVFVPIPWNLILTSTRIPSTR